MTLLAGHSASQKASGVGYIEIWKVRILFLYPLVPKLGKTWIKKKIESQKSFNFL